MKAHWPKLFGLLLLSWSVPIIVREWATIEPVLPALLILFGLLAIGLPALGKRVVAQRAMEGANHA